MKKGLIQVYTGNGKGKTTAALGLALRAIGHGYKVGMVQFMKKNDEYGEVKVSNLLPRFSLFQFGRNVFVKKNPEKIDIELAKDGFSFAREAMRKGEFDILILDEINVAIYFGLISEEDVLKLLDEKPPNVELILTGRYARDSIIKRADLVTEMKEIKHPYQNGVMAREGIEF